MVAILSRRDEFIHNSLTLQGFLHHTTKEHSMWSYIYYFLYLEDTNPKDYTALDSYVASMVGRRNLTHRPWEILIDILEN